MISLQDEFKRIDPSGDVHERLYRAHDHLPGHRRQHCHHAVAALVIVIGVTKGISVSSLINNYGVASHGVTARIRRIVAIFAYCLGHET